MRARAGATSDKARILAAIAKYGPSVQALAEKRYGISGEALLAKLAEGESRALSDPGGAAHAESEAGAKKWTQFTASSRAEAIRRFGIDPWADPDQAFHAASLHLRGKINGATGLEGYNPGMPTYKDYILGQHVGDVHAAARGGRSNAGAAPAAPTAPSSSSASSASSASPALTAAFDAGQQSRLSDALAAAAAPAPVVTGSLPALPDFAAGPSLPQGYQAPPAGGGPQPVQQQVQVPALSDLSLPDVAQQSAAVAADGTASSGRTTGLQRTAGAIVEEALSRADTLDARHLPYLWGGGHGGKVNDVSKTGPLDCSGAVSAILGINPRVSGDFERFGSSGKTKAKSGINIYANGEHVLMSIVVGGKERFFGTSRSNAGGGAGWIPRAQLNDEYLSRFTVRHLARADA